MYEASRSEYQNICTSERSALKIEICRYLINEVSTRNVPDNLADEIEALKNIVVDGIITTNWDLFIDKVFPDFKAYVGQDQLLFGVSQGVAEIYKIHGGVTDPNSLVLTQEDYNEFNKKNPYLAAKLLTTFIEHPIVFMGYSLSDKNVLSILDSITGCLNSSTVKKLQDRLVFVEWDPDVSKENVANSVISQHGIQIPVKHVITSSFLPIYNAMSKVQRRFPAQILRRLKDQVYDLVLNNDSAGKLYVKDIDEATPFEDVDVVFGVGAIKMLQRVGYVGILRDDVLRDVVFDDGDYDPEALLNMTMGGLLKGNTKFVPVFKYYNRSGRIRENGTFDATGLPEKVAEAARREWAYFQPTQEIYKNKFDGNRRYRAGIGVIRDDLGVEWACNMAPLIDPDVIACEEILNFLKENFERLIKSNSTRTSVSRLICYYDWLCYGRKMN